MEREIVETPNNNDSNDVYWKIDGKRLGCGYQGKKDNRFHVMRCPLCDRENYALAIAEGSCAFCQFDPN